MKRTLTFATLVALGAAAYIPLPSMARTDVNIVVRPAPPPLRYEAAPAPRRGYVWAAGHWEWSGHRHEWVRGYWIAERPGYVYSAPTWSRRDGGWYMEPARWSPYVRDRMDWRAREYQRAEWQRRHDRDGDGVPNRYDRAPNNPYRY